MIAAGRFVVPLSATAVVCAAVAAPALAETPNLVVPKPGEVVASGGVRVRVLPKKAMAAEECCVLQFQRRDGGGTWTVAPAFGAETAVADVADAVGASFRREAFASAVRWRVRARFTSDKDWTEWREFTVPPETSR